MDRSGHVGSSRWRGGHSYQDSRLVAKFSVPALRQGAEGEPRRSLGPSGDTVGGLPPTEEPTAGEDHWSMGV